ncbi:FecR family protein [Chitinophaga sp. Hz27]|uniref:FecR family protein n=1 Tax=Chitinophaga sp. Hz27 TaxID=3347169 RepID=UPI0035DBD172
MENNTERLRQILQSATRTPQEEQWLQAYLESGDTHALKELSAQEFEREMESGEPLPAATSDRLWDAIQQHTNIPIVSIADHRPKYQYLWWAAAAIGALCIAWPIFRHKPIKKEIPALANIRPAINKAVLTLADGSKVTLSDTGSQVISIGTTSIKQHDGALEYNHSSKDNMIAYNELATPKGGIFQVTLPDGSRVWLNAASQLKYPTTFKDKRIVTLTGQAYFEIEPDASMPFIVKTNGMDVQVLGTSFDVMSYEDEATTNTTLVQGAVVIKAGGQQQQLKPSEQSLLNNTSKTITTRKANIAQVLAWRNGKFELENTDLPAFLRQLSRWYDVEIVNSPAMNTDKRFGGQIGRDIGLNDVLKVLELYDIHCTLEGRKLTVISVK